MNSCKIISGFCPEEEALQRGYGSLKLYPLVQQKTHRFAESNFPMVADSRLDTENLFT